jgi:hypothetical protein
MLGADYKKNCAEVLNFGVFIFQPLELKINFLLIEVI